MVIGQCGEVDIGELPAEAVALEVDGYKMELLQSFQLSYGMWNATNELISSEIKGDQAKDGALTQNEVGIFPVKLLVLALSATRLFITSHVVDGKIPVNKLLDMFSTCRGRSGVEDGRSLRPPVM
uniref:Uncharacterized protein n=1 Tax=Oryza punctata TaxID=4537 RepID=A0A0E0JVN7_ORYPU